MSTSRSMRPNVGQKRPPINCQLRLRPPHPDTRSRTIAGTATTVRNVNHDQHGNQSDGIAITARRHRALRSGGASNAVNRITTARDPGVDDDQDEDHRDSARRGGSRPPGMRRATSSTVEVSITHRARRCASPAGRRSKTEQQQAQGDDENADVRVEELLSLCWVMALSAKGGKGDRTKWRPRSARRAAR